MSILRKELTDIANECNRNQFLHTILEKGLHWKD